jgi:hypothetical protein
MAELLKKIFSSVFTREDEQNIPTAAAMAAPNLDTVSIRNLRSSSAAGPD